MIIISAVKRIGWPFQGLAFLLAAFLLPAASAAQTLAPHRALYDLEQVKLSARSGIAAISGLMSMEFSGAVCEGFTTEMRMALKIRRKNGRMVISDLNANSWEDGPGKTYTFGNRQVLNGKITEDVSGRVRLGAAGIPGKGVLVKPKTKSFEVPASAVFPITHTRQVLDAARAGKSVYKTLVFDGTDTTKTVRSIAVIGKRVSGADVKLDIKNSGAREKLSGIPAWNIDVSYFSLDNQKADQTPSFRATYLIYDNGILANIRMEYDDFTVRGKLRSLALAEIPPC